MSELRSCYCVGPQNGQPLCPCQMRSVSIVDGMYVRTEELGPVRANVKPISLNTCPKCGFISSGSCKFCAGCGHRFASTEEQSS